MPARELQDVRVLLLRHPGGAGRQGVGELREELDRTGRLVVVDEDYEGFGLSGELAAVALEAGLRFRFGRVCTQTTIPYAHELEDETLPNVGRIVEACKKLVE